MIRPSHRPLHPQGIALITTLFIIALIMVAVVGMLTMGRRHLQSSSSQEVVVNLDSLRDTAINISISQLREATTQDDELWASQPGAIRTFAEDGGAPSQIFKLYSDDQMVEPFASANANLQNDLVSTWDQSPEIYADLNAPKTDENGERRFPIVDPRAFDGLPSGSLTPEGFSYTSVINGVTLNGVTLPTAGADKQRLPMPVRWIYQLKDGSMGTLDSSFTYQPFDGSTIATKTNPIVGRVAFWADDECGKVNVNTASEAIPWDTPRCYTPEDMAFALQQPVLNEVQRFGGHPATTCLSSIFYPGTYLDPTVAADAAEFQEIYDRVPRVHYDGGILAGSHERVTPDADRLYVSVDDVVYEGDVDSTSGEREVQIAGVSLEQRRFFLTANSRAPELNPAGRPRVALWPVHYDEAEVTSYRTPYDRVIQFVSALGYDTVPTGSSGIDTPDMSTGALYHYQRGARQSDGSDWVDPKPNKTSGGSGSGARVDLVSAIQNQKLAVYLAKSLGYDDGTLPPEPTAGYGANFFDKYQPRNMAYSVLSMFDYIRSTNLMDDTFIIDSDNDDVLDKRVTPFLPAWDGHSWNARETFRTGNLGSLGQQAGKLDELGSSGFTGLMDNFAVVGGSGDEDENKDVGRGLNTISRRYTLNEFAIVFTTLVKRIDDTGVDSVDFDPPSMASLGKDMFERGASRTEPNPNFDPNLPEDANTNPSTLPLPPGRELKLNERLVQASFICEVATPAVGYPQVVPGSSFNSSGFQNLEIDGGGLWQPRGYSSQTATNGNDIGVQVTDFGSPDDIIPTNSYYPMWGRSAFGGTGDYRIMSSGRHNLAGTNRWRFIYGSSLLDEFYIIETDDDTTDTMTIENTGGMSYAFVQNNIWRRFGSSSTGLNFGSVAVPIPGLPDSTGSGQGQWIDRLDKFFDAAEDATTIDEMSHEVIDPTDVVRSFVVSHGDTRIAAVTDIVGSNAGAAIGRAVNPLVQLGDWSDDQRHIHTLFKSGEPLEVAGQDRAAVIPLVPGVNYADNIAPDFGISPTIDPADYGTDSYSKSLSDDANDIMFFGGSSSVSAYPYSIAPGVTRDWDTGIGALRDGAYINLPDPGTHPIAGITPYFDTRFDYSIAHTVTSTTGPELLKPNLMIPSAGMFGSLPSAAADRIPWTTFLFRPELNEPHLGAIGRSRDAAGSNALGSRGSRDYPPDHMLMEYFWMPVVQPYAISEPFATAGKVGMNYRLAPFSHITRATGLHAVLKSEQMLAIPTGAGQTYKDEASLSSNSGWRHRLDAEKTLLQWEERFDQGDFFQSASEVCEMFLVPQGQASGLTTGTAVANTMRIFWDGRELTGDNVIERPYTNLYPRLTTKSNAYKVHYLVQTIKQALQADYNIFDADRSRVTGENQGNALIERFVDPQDEDLSLPEYDYLGDLTNTEKLDNLYQYRIRHVRKFAF